jgi:phage/plasmid-associated DNA primase
MTDNEEYEQSSNVKLLHTRQERKCCSPPRRKEECCVEAKEVKQPISRCEAQEVKHTIEDPTKWFYKLNEMFKYADKNNFKFYICADLPKGDGSKQYACFKNDVEFYDYYGRLPEEKKNFYEIQREGRPRYEVYDLEIEVKNLKQDQKLPTPEELFNHFITECYPQEIDEMYVNRRDEKPNWLVLDSSNKDKTSLHLKNSRRVFKNEADHKAWVNIFVKDSPLYSNFPDKSIYNKNQAIRMIGSTKINKNRYLKIWTAHNSNVSKRTMDYFITNVRDEETNLVEDNFIIPKLPDKITSETTEKGKDVRYEDMTSKKKDGKIRELCEAIVNGIKNNKIQKLHERGGDGVICYNDCMSLCCAIINEGIEQDKDFGDLVDKVLSLYRNRHTIDTRKIKESWISSSQQRRQNKEKCSVSDQPKASINTLYYYAYQAGWRSKSKREYLISSSLGGGHSDLAELYILESQDEPFINTYENGDSCYGYRWNNETLIYEKRTKEKMMNVMIQTIHPLVSDYSKSLRKKMKKEEEDEDEDEDDEKKKKKTKTKKAINKVIENLKTESFISNLFKNYAGKVQDIDFKKRLNNVSSWELPINDGLMINLKTLTVRKRTKDDLWTFYIRRNFVQNISRAYEYFLEVLKTKDKTDCFLQYVGYSISPSMRLKKIMICIGSKDTGKSTTLNMIRNAVSNDIMSSLSYKVLFSPKNESVHNEEFMKVKSIRVGVISEPDIKVPLSGEKVKGFVGNDPVDVRHCGGRLETLTSTCKGMLLTNRPPEIPADDTLTDKLIFCVFNNSFKKSLENEDKIRRLESDESFLDEVFSLIVLRGFDLHTSEEFFIPECMKNENDSYTNELNSVISFCKSRVRATTEDSKCQYVKKSSLYEAYKEFCTTNDFVPERKFNFFEQIRSHLGVSETKVHSNDRRTTYEVFKGFELVDLSI